MIEGTAEVRDVHRFDVSALERYLSGRIEGFRGPLGVRQFRGGQSNPTHYLEAGGREYALRRKPPGKPLPSAHAVDREYRVLAALASETEKIEAMERLMEWLPKNILASAVTTLVYGEYRRGNMIVHPSEPRVVAVLDWELSTLGHPIADLAYNCMPYHLGNEWEGLRDAPLAALGIPAEAEYLAAYCRRTKRPGIEHWDFYIAFAEFRLAAIAQGIMGRVIAGTANDPNARERGERARPLAEAGWRLVESRAR